MSLTNWMHDNLRTQGFDLTEVQVALVLESAPMLFALSAIGVVAGVRSRRPFDYVWNGVARRGSGAPPLPPDAARRRHAFKVATAWLLLVAALFTAGATTTGLIIGVMLVAACAGYGRRREVVPA